MDDKYLDIVDKLDFLFGFITELEELAAGICFPEFQCSFGIVTRAMRRHLEFAYRLLNLAQSNNKNESKALLCLINDLFELSVPISGGSHGNL